MEWGAVLSVGVARELTLVKDFFQIVGEQGHTFGYLDRLWTLAILFISFFLCNKGLYPEIIIFVYIRIRREGVIWI